MLLRVFYSRLKDVFRLFHKLPVQIDRVRIHAPFGIVLTEDVVGSLFVVLVDHGTMSLPLLAQRMRRLAVAALVCLVRAIEA